MRSAAASVAMWACVSLAGLGIASPGGAAESRGHVTAISVPILSLYRQADAESPDETIAREQVPLPLEVHEVAPNKRLKVNLGGGRWRWVDRGVVRTKGVQAGPTCGVDDRASPTPSVLAPRGLGKGCR
jgi:hypothetical protein